MRQQTINIYQFEELSESAQRRAYEDYACSDSFAWNGDYRKTLEVISKEFSHILVKDWSVEECRYSVSFRKGTSEWESYSELLEGDRESLIDWKKKFDEGKSFTGFCADYDFMEPILSMTVETIREMEEDEITDILKECFRSFFEAWQKDIEFSNSENNFKENVAPLYEYTVDGAKY